jgi:hypothetical protein
LLVSVSWDWNWDRRSFETKSWIIDESLDRLWGWSGLHPTHCEFEFVQFMDLWWVLWIVQIHQWLNNVYPRGSDQSDDFESSEKVLLFPFHTLQLYLRTQADIIHPMIELNQTDSVQSLLNNSIPKIYLQWNARKLR